MSFVELLSFNMLKSQCCIWITVNVPHPSMIIHPCLASSLLIFPGKCCHKSTLSFTFFLSFSSCVTSLRLSSFFSIFCVYPSTLPPLPFMPLVPSFLTHSPTTPSSVTGLAVQLIWGGILCVWVCVCVCNCVFACLSGLWLIRRLILILPDRAVLLWWSASHTQIHILHTETHANTQVYTVKNINTPKWKFLTIS